MLRALGLVLALLLATPALAQQSVIIPATISSVAINVSTSTTTLLVPAKTGQQVYVTNAFVIAGGTGGIKFIYGTGATCSGGQVALTGNVPLVANVGFTMGTGVGAILVVPQGNALCVNTDTATTYAGSMAFSQF